MTIKQAIDYAKNTGVDFMSARKILCYILNVDEKYIIINNEEDLDNSIFKRYENYIQQLKSGISIQYITHKQEFMGNEFYVDENVLIPQPDTEVLVEQAILKIKELLKTQKKVSVLDLCTGSGAIGISLKKYFTQYIEMYVSDISKKALEVAKKNSQTIIKEEQINFIQSDMFNNIDLKFDIIISNPPYIKTDVIYTLSKEVQNEPILALDGGADGLKFYKNIQENIKSYLNDEGYLLVEIGYDQKDAVMQLFERSICVHDYAGNDRVIIWRNEKNE